WLASRRWPIGRRALWLVAGSAVVVVALPLALIWIVPLPARLGVPPSTVVAYADGAPAYVFLSPDDKVRMRADLDSIDADYVKALVRFEDKRFWRHRGVDPLALLRAVWLNVTSGRRVSGGSTLAM